MRSARLLAILLIIQRSGRSTAEALAQELEVSTRTIYRDLAMLQVAGVPLWTEPGRNGGVRLVDGWRSPIDGFTTEEGAALVIGPAGAADLGLGAVLATAHSKVRSALPDAVRHQVEAVADRFHLDQQQWFQRAETTPWLETVAASVWNGQAIDLVYGTNDERPRRVDPLGLVLKNGVWYLVAASRQQARTYRVSRIKDATARDEPVTRPPGFVLADYWNASFDDFDASIRPLVTRLRVATGALAKLRRVVPGAITERAIAAGQPSAPGWTEIALPMEPIEVAVSQLVLLPDVEVLEPAELRVRLREHCDRLAASNR